MIKVNINKARDICHTVRRKVRSQEFEPLDAIVMKQIPGTNPAEAEAQRQAIRERYAEIQDQIDQTSDLGTLSQVYQNLYQKLDL